MNISLLIEELERTWDSEGFLGRVREGQFLKRESEQFLSLLRGIDINEDAHVPKRLLSLLWILPSFLEWQKERVAELGGDTVAYRSFVNEVHNILTDVLGYP